MALWGVLIIGIVMGIGFTLIAIGLILFDW